MLTTRHLIFSAFIVSMMLVAQSVLSASNTDSRSGGGIMSVAGFYAMGITTPGAAFDPTGSDTSGASSSASGVSPSTVSITSSPKTITSKDPINIEITLSNVPIFENIGTRNLSGISVKNGTATSATPVFGGAKGSFPFRISITPSGKGDIEFLVGQTFTTVQGIPIVAMTNPLIIVCGTGCKTVSTTTTAKTKQNRIKQASANNAQRVARGSRSANLGGRAGSRLGGGTGGGSGTGGTGGTPTKFTNTGFSLAGAAGARDWDFSFNLANAVNTAAHMNASTASDGRYTPVIKNPYKSDFDLWMKGTWINTEDDRADTDEESEYGIFHVGVDYRYSRDMLLGVMLQVDKADSDSKITTTETETDGWLVGPYLVKRFENGLVMDLLASWGKSKNELSINNATPDKYDTERFLFAGNITGTMTKGKWKIAPSAGLVYFKEKQESYTDSNGLSVGSQTSGLGSINFGPTFSYEFSNSNGTVFQPNFKIEGIYDFKAPDLTDALGNNVSTKGLRAQVSAGIDMQMKTGTVYSANFAYDGIGESGYSSKTFDVSFRTPINLRGSKEDASFSGRYTLSGIRDIDLQNETDTPNDLTFSISIPIQ